MVMPSERFRFREERRIVQDRRQPTPAEPVVGTPRTDRAIMDTHWEGTSVYPLVRADFARQLELENNELRRKFAALQK